ncbi:MAG: elongation factor P--(R)-beta-lysine ligase [Spirochaetae bacterium HGW-Spirochaetae-2]|jgi:lysyl-tRNA synthetase class 2|nr:MAG: elongation factor P--(R)-beta-lysine ligase [Spirochaetae bacterium HGW-Spirochaetae-2]
MNIQAIGERSELLRTMRSWFADNDYLEVSTPILSTHLIPEPTIANFATQYISEFHGSRELYLVPSPEVHMKRIIAETKRNIYQFSHCFRNREQIGSYHNPEFTMLEYYTVGADDEDSIAITEELVVRTALAGTPESVLPPFRRMTVAEACKRYAQFDLDTTQSVAALRKEATRLGLSVPAQPESWEETFNRIFLNFVEPNLPQDRPLVLCEYPKQIVCLAKEIPGRPYRRRWELYAGGIELANCYDEERDKAKVEAYYREQYAILANQRSVSGEVIPDIDTRFPEIFDASFPQCSGVAMGIDRLLMLQGRHKTIGDLILFNVSDMMADG